MREGGIHAPVGACKRFKIFKVICKLGGQERFKIFKVMFDSYS